jgi:hypothetical protein
MKYSTGYKLQVQLFTLLLVFAISTNMLNSQTIKNIAKNNNSATIGTSKGINFREAGFSGLFAIPGTNGKEFWTCSDRGVNVDCGNANPSTCRPTYDKMYSFPSYAPKIHRIRIKGNEVEILQTITIKRPDGTTATGLLNPTGLGSTAAEVASIDTVMDCGVANANFFLKTAAKDTFGIDSEGIIVDKNGNFWLCEEGGPTIWVLNPNGVLIKRYTPYANLTDGSKRSVDVAIDTVFKYRKNNRGFEGITIAPNGKVYAIIQSAILYPTQSIGENSRVHRILEIDPSTDATRMLVYLNDGLIGASGSNQIRLRDWKIGDMSAISDTTFLVLEAAARGTTDVKRLYKINITGATNVHSGLYSGVTLENLVTSTADNLAANSIVPVKKTLVMDLLASGWPAELDKAEGLAIINDSTIAICNDNDYGQTCPLADGLPLPTSNLSTVITYQLDAANKLLGYRAAPTPLLSQGITAVSSSQTPYLNPLNSNTSFTSILTVGDFANNGYRMTGIPDGAGAYDNNDGTFTLLLNHEFGNSAGVTRAHGSAGAFISKWTINKNDLTVLSGSDLIQNVNLWNGSGYTTYNKQNPSSSAAFNRFCSADLPDLSAFYNSKTNNGTKERIFMNGEEAGSEGRGFAHIITGPNAGTSYELPYLGKFSWENALANPKEQEKTIVAGTDDATPGQVYIYVGTKTNTGTEIDKAGLTNGKLYGIAVSGYTTEVSGSFPAENTSFSLIDLGNVSNLTGAQLNTNSNNAGVTNFLRPEDASWDPSNPNDLYFVTTNGFGSPSRMWRAKFTDITNPLAGGTITAVLDGTEGQQMLDNMTISKNGLAFLQEDVGNNVHNGKIWQYSISNDKLTQVAQHDPNRFIAGASNYLTQDEESSGVIDVQHILGAGNFLLVDQAHYSIPGELVEGGQILKMFNQTEANLGKGASISSSQTPYLLPTQSNVSINAILTVGDSTSNGYKMVGLPDGVGAFENGNGTFTMLINHELGTSAGVARAHGSAGAFVSKWVINKSDLSVQSGSDLIQNVNLWNGSGYTTYNKLNPSPLAAFNRFCSADLPEISAFYNSKTTNGTSERIFMNGEEAGSEGRGFANIVTGPNAGTTYELPYLGKFSWENAIANPTEQEKTIVVGTDDATPGQVYVYVGTKTNSGTEIDKAGLTNGKLYGIAVSGMTTETSATFPAANTTFTLVDLGNVSNLTGAQLNTNSNAAGVTNFLRPEDASWDPQNPKDLYFVTTNAFNSPSRMWRARFNDITNPTLGGTITAVLDGTEGQQMMDNMTVDNFGNIFIQEDVGNNVHNGKIWQYKIATDQLTQVAQHDPNRFILGAANYLTQDEEASGIIDASKILGPGNYLLVDQAHYSIPGELAEGGQILRMYCPNYLNISVANYPTVSHCATSANSFTVNYQVNMNVNSNNEFLLQMSDAQGSFTNARVIGKAQSFNSNSITASIPTNVGPGNYRLRVVSTSPASISNESANSVLITGSLSAPFIASQPKSSNLCIGVNYQLNFNVSGSTNLKYQWYKDNVIINGATQASLNLTSVNYASSGVYHCTAAETINGCLYSLQSNKTPIYVSGGASIVDQPLNTWTNLKSIVTLNVGAHFTGYNKLNPPSVQWYKNSIAMKDDERISGSKSNMLTITNVQPADTNGDYYVIVTGACTSPIQSKSVKIYISNITIANIADETRCEGDSVIFSSNASANNNAELSYQWMLNGVNLSDNANTMGAKSKTLTLKNLTSANSGKYSLAVKAKNSTSTVMSNSANLNVNSKVRITKQAEANLNVQVNKDLTLTVLTSGTNPITYQWYKDNSPIAMATNATFTKTAVTLADAGTYYVWVKNTCDSVKSNNTIVTTSAAGITSIEDENQTNMMSLSPNPVNNNTVLRLTKSLKNANIVIQDLLGNTYTIANNIDIERELELQLGKFNLSSANYTLTIYTIDQSYSIPFIYIR